MGKQIPAAVAARGDLYSEVVIGGGLVFVAGQVGLATNQAAAVVPFLDEARSTFENVGAALALVGLGLADVVRCTVYLTDFRDFEAMGGVFRSVFPERPPARTTVGVTALARDCRIEVEATAAK